jgi:uncharacterized protein (DUF58 family)
MWLNTTRRQQQSSRFSSANVAEQLHALKSDGVHLALPELLAYQPKTALVDSKRKNKASSRMAGGYLSRHKGRGMEFDEVRLYQAGDDIRTIDWRVTARTGKTYTKLFREEVERPVIIGCDLTHSMQFGSQLLFKAVQAGHLAALLAWHSKRNGDKVGGIVFNDQQHRESKPRSRQQGVLHFLHEIIQIQQSQLASNTVNSAAFEHNCARLRHIARPGSLVYLITDGLQITDKARNHLRKIAQHGELIVCLIADPLEQQLPQSSIKQTLTMTDGQQQQLITLGDTTTYKQYQQQAEQWRQQLSTQLISIGARIQYVSAAYPLEHQLNKGQ